MRRDAFPAHSVCPAQPWRHRLRLTALGAARCSCLRTDTRGNCPVPVNTTGPDCDVQSRNQSRPGHGETLEYGILKFWSPRIENGFGQTRKPRLELGLDADGATSGLLIGGCGQHCQPRGILVAGQPYLLQPTSCGGLWGASWLPRQDNRDTEVGSASHTH